MSVPTLLLPIFLYHFLISSQVTFHFATDILMNFLVPFFARLFTSNPHHGILMFSSYFSISSISIRFVYKVFLSLLGSAARKRTFKYSSSNNKSSETVFYSPLIQHAIPFRWNNSRDFSCWSFQSYFPWKLVSPNFSTRLIWGGVEEKFGVKFLDV